MLSIYPLNKMKTAADANDGNQEDEGVVLVGGTLRKKENHNVKRADLNEVHQRMLVFLEPTTWACGNHVIEDPWTRAARDTVQRTLYRCVWQGCGDKNQSIRHVLNCWKGTMIP